MTTNMTNIWMHLNQIQQLLINFNIVYGYDLYFLTHFKAQFGNNVNITLVC